MLTGTTLQLYRANKAMSGPEDVHQRARRPVSIPFSPASSSSDVLSTTPSIRQAPVQTGSFETSSLLPSSSSSIAQNTLPGSRNRSRSRSRTTARSGSGAGPGATTEQPELSQLQEDYQRHYVQQLLYNQQFRQLHTSSNQLLTLNSSMPSYVVNTNYPNEMPDSNYGIASATSALLPGMNASERNIGRQTLQQTQPDGLSSTKDASTCPYGCCNTPSISEHLFLKGLVRGDHYDVIIRAFGKKYKLHKLFLDRSPYFRSLFSWSSNMKSFAGPGLDSEESDSDSNSSVSDTGLEKNPTRATKVDSDYRKVYDLPFEEDNGPPDSLSLNCKQKSFELAISRLYGAVNLKEEYKIPYNMIEIGQYLALSDIVCTATDYIVKNMNISNLAENLRFAITSDYGSASQRIIENGKGILCSNGWEQGPDAWDGIPTTIAAEVLGEDYFFVPTEWDRCIFIIKLIERRLESSNLEDEIENVTPLKEVLNEKIHYCHIPPDQLQELEELCDINGETYIDPHVLHSALWQAVQLETLISRAQDSPHLDSVITCPTQPSTNHKWFKVPSKDETLSGLPKELNVLLSQSLSASAVNQLNSDDSKTTQGETNTSKTDEKMFVWTKIPPFRFSISFANVSELSTDKRVYGKTFWYAGSYWNLYLQKSHIQSKNSYQVGVYLHRAHNGSSNSSSKSGLINPDVYANNVNYRSLPKKYNRKEKILSYQTVPVDRSEANSSELYGNRSNESTLESLGMNMLDLSISDDSRPSAGSYDRISKLSKRKSNSMINYEDQRNAIKVYFIIFTPSRRAMPTITSFLSVPNDFSKSQSWGWKSNNMCVFNEDGTFAEGQDSNLKFMILLGNV